MLRKLMWLVGLITLAVFVSSLIDRHRARQRRELWAEATDPA